MRPVSASRIGYGRERCRPSSSLSSRTFIEDSLAETPVGQAAVSRSRVLLAATLRSVDAKSRGGIARELAGRADGPVDQLAGAIGAKPAERSRAVHAEGALEGTDPRVGRIRRQIPIAALTAGSN